MPKDDNPNGQTPKQNMPESLSFERTQVICRRCKKEFKHFVIEVIEDLTQLRCGDTLITELEATCLHCGWIFNWDVRRKDLESAAVAYGQLSAKIDRYNPE